MGQFLQFCCPRAGDWHIVENCSTALSHIMLLLTELLTDSHHAHVQANTLYAVCWAAERANSERTGEPSGLYNESD